MDEENSQDILINKYLAPEWRPVAKNLEGYLPVGYIDALIDAAKRMTEDERKEKQLVSPQ